MELFNIITLLLIFGLTPAGVIWLCNKIGWLGKLGPIMVLYAVGMIFGNLPFLPQQILAIQEILPNILIPLAIPMMLFNCSFSKSEAPLQIKLAFSGFLSVVIAVVAGYLLFGQHIEQGREIGAIITGMYTGGTLNGASLQSIFGIKSEYFVLLNSYDIIISFLYFVFLFTFGIKMFRKLYGVPENVADFTGGNPENNIESQIETEPSKDAPYRRVFTSEGLRQLLKVISLSITVALISSGIALLLPDSWFMVIFILLITTLGVACSFIPAVRRLDLSYDAGMYLIYIFSMIIASMANFSNLDLAGGINQFLFMVVAVFISLFLHALFCRILKTDADSMIISSVAFINSPPFVPMAAAAMNNRNALVTGLGAGIVGYAAGNHLGVLVEQLLRLLNVSAI